MRPDRRWWYGPFPISKKSPGNDRANEFLKSLLRFSRDAQLGLGVNHRHRRLLMNELTERLTVEQPIIMGGADPTVEELRHRTGEMGYVLVKFTQTRGGTELGFPVDRPATDLSKANFDDGTGTVHIEGQLILNDDPVRCIADLDLATLKGTGRLALEEKVAAATD
jgi:hypothetical protein